jgi:hypothetical protein
MGLNRRLERRLEVVLPLGSRPARPGRLHRRCFARACGGRGYAARKPRNRSGADESTKGKLTYCGGSAVIREDRRVFVPQPLLSLPPPPVFGLRGMDIITSLHVYCNGSGL